MGCLSGWLIISVSLVCYLRLGCLRVGLSFRMAYYLCIISMLSQTRVSQNGLSFRMAYYLCVLSQTKVSQSGSFLWTAYYLCVLSQTRVSQSGLSKSKLSVTRVSLSHCELSYGRPGLDVECL